MGLAEASAPAPPLRMNCGTMGCSPGHGDNLNCSEGESRHRTHIHRTYGSRQNRRTRSINSRIHGSAGRAGRVGWEFRAPKAARPSEPCPTAFQLALQLHPLVRRGNPFARVSSKVTSGALRRLVKTGEDRWATLTLVMKPIIVAHLGRGHQANGLMRPAQSEVRHSRSRKQDRRSVRTSK